MNSEERHEARYQRRKAAREASLRAKLDRYDSLERVASPAALVRAHWDARRGVLWKASPARYDKSYLRNAARDSRLLLSGKAACAGFYVFDIMERGKRRHIHSLHYSERVIRRSLCINALVPIFTNSLIYDNGASLKGKGVSFAEKRCETHLHRYFRENHSNEGYVLIIDFSMYFDRIPHSFLFQRIDRYIKDPALNQLTKSCIRAGDYDKQPEEKGRGLFIGPEDSQIHAIAFPDPIDHIIKDRWRMKYYARYNDDSYIIHRSREVLQKIKEELLRLYAKFGIVPNPKKTQIVKLSKGFTFLKTRYILTNSGKLIRRPHRPNVTRQRRKLKALRKFLDRGEILPEKAVQSYMSWRGRMKRKEARRITYKMDLLFYDLFHCKPWKKGEISYGTNKRNPGRDQRPQANVGPDGSFRQQIHRGTFQRVQGEHSPQPAV